MQVPNSEIKFPGTEDLLVISLSMVCLCRGHILNRCWEKLKQINNRSKRNLVFDSPLMCNVYLYDWK